MRNNKKENREPRKQVNQLSADQIGVHHGDARELSKGLLDGSIDVTVTSPPYFDLKDYGVKNQIGYGQKYSAYLDDLQGVFSEIYRATKLTGSLWVIIDTFRRDQEVLPLPFDLAAKLREVGWKLHDVIIWKKERTLPWAHKGTTRKIFEYILVFAKDSKKIQYFPDRCREVVDLKRWWVRYPERYSPKGKALEEIWSYDIPTQGSWGKNYIRHFCPLPEGLVSRIINLTTNSGDVVLDPFSGTGTVLTQAQLLRRRYIGFELNKKYIEMFRKFLSKRLRVEVNDTENVDLLIDAKTFEKRIFDLRILKYARLLYRATEKKFGKNNVQYVFARYLKSKKVTALHKQCVAEFRILVSKNCLTKVRKSLENICSIPPLSKFGIDQKVLVTSRASDLVSINKTKRIYSYTATNSHQYVAAENIRVAMQGGAPVLSVIKVYVEVPDG